MKISDFSINRAVTTTMLILLIVLVGIISFTRLNIGLYPDITFPGAAIITSYEGVGSEEIENLITKEIEGAVATVEGVNNITSTSSMGQSSVVIEFNWGRDMDFAVQDLREQVDLISSAVLPYGADDPLIFKFDPASLPIIMYGVSSSDLQLAELKQRTEDDLIPRLERLPGVAQVNLQGGLDREILVSLKRDKLNYYNLDYSFVSNILAQENVNVSAGDVVQGNKNLLVRTTGKFESLDEIRKINIPVAASGQVKLSDIAEVEEGFSDVNTISRSDGMRSLGIAIQKQTDANTVEVANNVKAEMAAIESENDDLNFVLAMDQAEFIQNAIDNVSRNAIIGGLLAIIILFLFLRNIRSTIIIATAIPVSIIATFAMMFFADINLNIISLGGLALGVGMLVDNAIVVLENIYRYRSIGEGRIEAAREGSSEVGMAIIASTMTTVIVFLPILFVEGLAARLFKDLAFTVAFSLLASLLVALTLIPMLSSKILKITQKEIKRQKEEGKIISIYKSMLKKALHHRLIVVIVLIVLFVGSLALAPLIGFEFLPSSDQGAFSISYNLPVGTVLSETNDVAFQIEEVLEDIPEVETIFTNVGTSNMMQMDMSSNAGTINVDLVELDERDRSTTEIMEEVRNKINIPDVELDISDMQGGGNQRPVNIKLRGDDLGVLEEYSQIAMDSIRDVEGLRELEDSFEEGRPELLIQIDRSLASQFGLNVSQVANTVRNAVSGSVRSRYEVAGDEYNIRVQLEEDQIASYSDVSNLNILSPTGEQVSLNRISNLVLSEGPEEVLRSDQERYAEISADLFQRDLGSVMTDIRARLSEVELPEGYSFSYEGEFEDLQSSFSNLAFAFAVAIILVYMVMASQFESLIHPFIIMFTIPMALIGVLLGLFISGSVISVSSLIGLITLAGIVVNNAIVMVDYINTLRRRGKDKIEAIITGGVVRFRPIMMTALTTILGLTPIALGIGEGAELSQPIGVVIVSGLSFATLLTLFIIPIFYSFLTDFREIIICKLKGISREEARKRI